MENMEYLFNNRGKIKEKLKEKYIYLFLDYDGTIAEIAPTPAEAELPPKTKDLLLELSQRPGLKIAVISGRAIGDLKNRVGLKNIVYVGNHGLEIEGPKIKYRAHISERSKVLFAQIKNDLKERLKEIKGVILEDKGLALTLHYRLADKQAIPQIKTIFHEAAILHLVGGRVKIRAGKMYFEARLPLEWDKGKAVLWLLARQKFSLGERSILPVYFGDDDTDEDAFKALKKEGLTIFVGEARETHAQYYVKNSKEVAEFLEDLCRN